MSDSEAETKSALLEPELRDMKIEEGAPQAFEGATNTRVKVEVKEEQSPAPMMNGISSLPKSKSCSGSRSPNKEPKPSLSTDEDEEKEEVVGGDITLKMEPGKAPKLSRTASRRIIARPPPLFLNVPDATDEAKRTFQVLSECTYGAKWMGTTEHVFECDCAEDWDSATKSNHACGEDSDCINRATKMECADDCGCGSACQNQRFLRKQYANVTVINTEKKGYGLRANADLKPNEFIYEYIGEVINENTFRRRMLHYDEEGIKHFYFMSLTKGEFVDATKKGNLGRFCNHSCNPNCYVDKWVVGEKLRMGIFAERNIKAGEELVFNYNVDRYGADPQPCYCGEPNCTGFIGGKTQTDSATKLSHATIEALGIDDGDGWDTAVARKPRKKKVSEDDEEYVNDIQPKSLEENGVTKVMAALMQCQEKWIAVKLLSRIQRSDDEKVGHRVIRMHGYTILKNTLNTWIDDFNVVLQVLDILERLPRITRNKIQDSKIEETIEKLKSCGDARAESKAKNLLDVWSKLKLGYRIPRIKRDPNTGDASVKTENHFQRREHTTQRRKSRSPSPSIDAPRGPSAASAPSGPRSTLAQRNLNGPRPPFRPRAPVFQPLPAGWSQATAENGAVYYYSSNGTTQWQRPLTPANQPPPPPSKHQLERQRLADIISDITKNATPTATTSASATPQPSEQSRPEEKSKSEKWKKLPEEKRMKIYENTLFPHVKSVTDHYRKKLEKDDLKRLAKDVAKKLVRGDFKAGRVQDPAAKLSSKHEKSIKKFVKEFMDKAVAKKAARDKEKAARAESKVTEVDLGVVAKDIKEDSDEDVANLLEEEDNTSQQVSPAGSSATDRKRKRGEDDSPDSPKKTRTGTPPVAPPPPPPPPPPTEDRPADLDDSGFPSVIDASEAMQLATPPTTMNGSYKEVTVADSL